MDKSGSDNAYGGKEDSIDEKKLQQDDESSVSSVEGPFSQSSSIINLVCGNIRFSPPILEFVNAYEGKQFSELFTVQNIGRNPVYVQIGYPSSFRFRLKKPTQRQKLLPSGTCLTKVVTYTHHNDDIVLRSQIPVKINGTLVELPIVVKKAQPKIHIQPQILNFEIINLGAAAKSLTLTIHNTGGKRTKFEIDCGKNHDMVVTPTQGTVRPRQPVSVCVEIMGFTEGEYYQELWIKTSENPIRVPVLVEVVRPRLEIVYPLGTDNFTLINFGPTFRGAQQVRSFILKNISVETTMFVTLAELDGELQLLKDARNLSETFTWLEITAAEGRLESFENRIISVLFHPKSKTPKKGWRHVEDENKNGQCNIVAFFRIQTLHGIDLNELTKMGLNEVFQMENDLENERSSSSQLNDLSDSANPVESRPTQLKPLNSAPVQEHKTLRLCVHGQAVDPDIIVQPTSLDFGDLVVSQTENKVIRVTNRSIIPVKCKLCKKLNVRTTPQDVWLKSGKAEEFLISLTPSFSGIFETELKIEFLAESDVYYSSDKTLVTVFVTTVHLSYTVRYVNTPLTPKIGLGITPLLKDGVGFYKELLTFKDVHKCPRAAVLGLKQGYKPEWMWKEVDQVNNVDNAMIAFPNDRSGLFPPWPKEKICRTIFKGFYRYAPPEDLIYTLTPEGRIKKMERRAVWNEYISHGLKKEKYPCLKELQCLNDDMCRGRLLGKGKLNPNSTFKIQNASPNDVVPQSTLVPLTPLFLHRIEVEPKLINFNMVAISTKSEETIIIRNMNPFPISISFIPGNSNVCLLQSDTNIIQPNTTKYMKVSLCTGEFGQFFGFLSYEINGFHRFSIPISALVLPKTLILHGRSLTFGVGGPNETFLPNSLFFVVENILQTPIAYRIMLLEDSIFQIELKEGQIPPRIQYYAEVSINLKPKKPFFSEISITSESGATEGIKLSYPCKNVNVNFIADQINMEEIPLNLPTKARPVILNSCYHDVCFEVLTVNPMPGVTVKPTEGVIRARSYFHLEVIIQIPVIMEFSFEIAISIHISHKIFVTITGNVVFPKVRIFPPEVTIKKICEHSFDICAVCFANEGRTPAEVTLDFTSYPEFKMEGSSTIRIPAKKAEKVLFRFEPQNISRFFFYLPVVINQILGPPVIQEKGSEFASYYLSKFESDYEDFGKVFDTQENKIRVPCVFINCTAMKGLLHISPMHIHFQQECKTEPQRIGIKNISEDKVTFCFRNDDLGESNDSPFNLVPISTTSTEPRLKSMKAQLGPGEKLFLSATFEPKKFGDYKIQVPVFVRGYNDGLVYNYIRLTGQWKAPCIYPKSSEVYFGPVPLGVSCEKILKIYAENYRSPDTISCVVCNAQGLEGDLSQIRIKWLDEPNLGEGKKTFQLQIIFESFVPVSMRKHVILLDSLGVYASIRITAVADNSALTTHMFLSTRSNKYKFIREPEPAVQKPRDSEQQVDPKPNPIDKLKTKSILIIQESSEKMEEKPVEVQFAGETADSKDEPVEKGPKLVVHLTKSMTRVSQLGFASVFSTPCKKCESPTEIAPKKLHLPTSVASQSVLSSKLHFSSKTSKGYTSVNDFSYPNFPNKNHTHWEYFRRTVTYVERWMFEVVMRCDQYFNIPQSFQEIKIPPTNRGKKRGRNPKDKKPHKHVEKDFLSFLKEILVNEYLPKRPEIPGGTSPSDRCRILRNYFLDILQLLESRGCLLAYVRPEYLMQYEDYDAYVKCTDNVDIFLWEVSEVKNSSSLKIIEDSRTQSQIFEKGKNEGVEIASSTVSIPKDFWSKSTFEFDQQEDSDSEKQEESNAHKDYSKEEGLGLPELTRRFDHVVEVLDEETFKARSIQSWLDVVIQIFRVFVLTSVVKEKTISSVSVSTSAEEKATKIVHLSRSGNYFRHKTNSLQIVDVDSLSSNIYTSQERILLGWLKYHVEAQREVLWKNKCVPLKYINNFSKDLADSVAFISLTASYCPYIVPYFFKDVSPKPDTQDMLHHNAGKLIMAWRALRLGLTVDTVDILQPNPLFMVILLTHLYNVLPSLYPTSTINIKAPLNSVSSRKIQLKNKSAEQLVYEAKFFGEHEMFFHVEGQNPLVLKASKSRALSVVFSARQIKKISAVLFLCGVVESPNFGQHVAFYLEGEPSELKEWSKLSFSAPLYKVICSEITISPPYPESALYEVWYTTRTPKYSGEPNSTFKPWSEIWKTKISRRLFLEKGEVEIENGTQTTLGIAVACLTQMKRTFWLLFRSEIGAFIIQIEITPKLTERLVSLSGFISEVSSDPLCTCLRKDPPKIQIDCPLVVPLKIPMRNDPLWDALRKMFLKSLHQQEKFFWNQFFEKDIGIRLLLWLIGPDEDEEVVDEFVGILNTKVSYSLTTDPPTTDYFVIPDTMEIPDVREKSEIVLPIHLSKDPPSDLKFTLTMISENKKEIRCIGVELRSINSEEDSSQNSQRTSRKNIFSFACRP